MANVTVVYNKKNKKLIPFSYAENGEIIITSSGEIIDNLVVGVVDAECVDWDGGYVYDKKETARLL